MTKINGTLSIKDFVKREKPPEQQPVLDFMKGYEHLPEDIQQLVCIHTFKRPHGTRTVDYFVERFLIEPFTDAGVNLRTMYSKGGEPLAVVMTTDASSRTMFSAHVDTVHRNAGRQLVEYDHELGLMLKPHDPEKADNECLGADDGAGVWVLIQMLKANVPGTYVFHYGEEVGGIGSSTIARENQDWLAQFDRAIAVDRKGSEDIITHQGWGRCCSDEFAEALAEQLNMVGQGHSFKPDNGGVFTDTANYTDDIPECTNLSCGYDAQHTHNENLDVEFLIRLKDAMIAVDWESLPTVRKAGDVDNLYDYGGYGGWSYGKYGKYAAHGTTQTGGKEVSAVAPLERIKRMTTGEIRKWVRDNAVDTIVDVLVEAADTISGLEDEVDYLRTSLDIYEHTTQYDGDDDDDNDPKGVGKW